MIELLTDFFSFRDANIRFVVFGSVLLAASSAVVGSFTLLRKRALVGDAVAHAVLPGVCLAFMLSGNKNPLILLIGAMITGWLSLYLIDIITAKSRIKEDTAIGLVLSVFFGIGILLLTSIQKSENAAQSGLDKFLFGKAASLVGADLLTFGIVAVILVSLVLIFYKEFLLLSFDEDYAKSVGMPVRLVEFVLTTLTVMAVVIGIQAVGVVLMAAMLITPAVAARYWTEKLGIMLVLAAIFGALSGLSGAFISYARPSMPTGPWIVTVVSLIAVFSVLLAPGKGVVARVMRQRKNRLKMLDENILKMFYHLGEVSGEFFSPRTEKDLLAKRSLLPAQLRTGLRRLLLQRYLKRTGQGYALTQQGKVRGARVTRIHRLWELYLTTYLRIAPDHVHEDAEAIEHVITPEIEALLEKRLDFPSTDPHRKEIPRK